MKNINERLKAKAKKIQEAVSIGRESEDYGWSPLTQAGTERDLPSITQKRMQDIAIYLYDANPLAHRIIEMYKDFTIGDGFKVEAKDTDVQKLIDDFWHDPDNDFDTKLDLKVKELSLFGELTMPTFVNKHNGHVKLGYIDPGRIIRVLLDRNNPEIIREVHWRKRSVSYNYWTQKLPVINYDMDPHHAGSDTYERLVGKCFYFTINRISASTRGKSDLLCIADMIDAYDQFLFSRLERAYILNAYIWDVTLEGMDENEIVEFAKKQQMPKAASMRFHNERVKWNAVVPKLESSDASNEAQMFRNQILSGAGFPGHYFGDVAQTTRGTATETNLPTLKMLRSRQRLFKSIITFILKYIIDQAIMANYLINKKTDTSFVVIPSPIRERITFSKYEMKNKRAADDEIVGKTEEEKAYEDEPNKPERGEKEKKGK